MDKQKQRATLDALSAWERTFKADARADKSRLLREHLAILGLEGESSNALAATIHAVQTSVIYLMMDGSKYNEFLDLQRYDPSSAPGARYAFTFDFYRGFGRVLVANLRQIDLADLFDAPWNEHRVAGYTTFWISRVDGHKFRKKEVDKLEDDVLADYMFDYDEEELSVIFDTADDGRTIRVDVYEVDEADRDMLANGQGEDDQEEADHGEADQE